ncbi:hypothetical protein D8Y24_07120 [Agrococcus lahaulensis]|nr:hypothetical protein D8Y24_07120 [Agrococcus lahaulensis]
MRRGSRILTAAAALITGAAVAGCGPTAPPPVTVSPPPPLPTQDASVVSPPLAGPVSQPEGVPRPTAPTVHYDGPPSASPPAAPEPEPSVAPVATSAPAPPPEPRPTPSPSPAEPAALLDLLLDPGALPPLRWSGADGEAEAAWTRLAPSTVVEPADAIAHLGVARGIGGDCAAAADAVDGAATEAALVALAAEPAPGAPMNVVLLRYGSEAAAAAAATALHALGIACDGEVAEAGALGTGGGAHTATVLLTGPVASLVVEADAHGALLVAVVHQVAPPEAVEQLLRAQVERLG